MDCYFLFCGGNLVGLGRLELPTSPLSGVRSNQAELQTHVRGASILQQIQYSS